MKARASVTASWWASSICAATSGGAIAHRVLTDFTGENVRSNPPTALVRGPGQFRDRPGQLPGIPGVATVLGTEELGGDLRADPGPIRRSDGVVAGVPQGGGVLLDALRDLHLERRRPGRVDLVRHPQPSRGTVVPLGQAGALQGLLAQLGEGVQPEPEQQPHLLRGDLVPDRQAVDPGHAGPHPPPRGLTPLGVVRRQRGAWPAGPVVSSHLPRQVRVPGPGGELVQRMVILPNAIGRGRWGH